MIKGFEIKTLIRLGLAGSALAAIAACSGGDSTPPLGPKTQPTAQQQSAISTMQDSLTSLASVDIQSSNAAGAAFAYIGASGELFINGAVALAPKLPALRLRPHDACEVDGANSVTWTNCPENGGTINGSISWTTSSVMMNVHITLTSNGESLDYTLAGSITVSSTAIKGDTTLDFTLAGPQASGSAKLHSTVDVQLASGCITSGTLTVTETANLTSGSAHENVDEAVEVDWTGCNMATVRNSQ